MATLNFALKQCNKFAVMEMSFLLFIGFASRAKQGHPEQKENNGANGILKLVNKNLTLQFLWKNDLF